MSQTFLKLHVTPRGSRNEITGWRENALCIKITAPPVEGAANAAIVKFMADALKLKKSQVELVAGDKSREKIVRISGLSEDEIKSRLAANG